MTTKSAVEHWIELADYDWKSAQTMFKAKLYLYVGFLCHQVIEKLYKALFTKLHENIPPYTHDLIKLASLTKAPADEKFKKLLNDLNPLYRAPLKTSICHCERPMGAKQSPANSCLMGIASSASPPRNDTMQVFRGALYKVPLSSLQSSNISNSQ